MRKFSILLLALCLLALLLPAAALAADKPAPPTIDPVNVGEITVSGTCEPGARVTVYYAPPNMPSQPITAVVTDGTWTAILLQPCKYGATITVAQTISGATSPLATFTVRPPAPAINTPIVAGATEISGTCELGASVDGYYTPPGGTPPLPLWVTVAPDTWTAVLSQPCEPGGIITVTQNAGDGGSNPATATVVPPAPTINTPIAGTNVTITGTCYNASAQVSVTLPNSAPVTAAVTGNTWSVLAASLNPGDTVSATQTVNGATSNPATAIVSTLTINTPVLAGTTLLTGTYESPARVEVSYTPPGGTPQYLTTASYSNDTWAADLFRPCEPGGIIITVTQNAGNGVSNPVTATVIPPAPTINTPVAGTNVTITGTCYNASAQVTVTLPNSASVTAAVTGNTWSVLAASLAPGDTITATQTVNGAASNPATAIVIPPVPTVNQPYHGDTTVSGIGYPGADITLSNMATGGMLYAVVNPDTDSWSISMTPPLIAGTKYRVFQIVNGLQSDYVSIIVLPTTPGAPTRISAEPDNQQVTLYWDAPTNNGGRTLESYTISEKDGKITPIQNLPASDPSSTLTFSVRDNGVEYTFQIVAVNSEGPGDPATFAVVVPNTAPNAPQNLQAIPGNASATLSWQPPTTGDGTIDGYEVSSDEGQTWIDVKTDLTYPFPALTNGKEYTLSVRAYNNKAYSNTGYSPAVKANPVTPAATPGAPIPGSATPGDRQVTLHWSAPTDNGGKTITGYIIKEQKLGEILVSDPSAIEYTVPNLTNGVPYYFTIFATNGTPDGSAPAYYPAVTPNVLPNAPQNPQASAANQSATLTWTAPADNGGTIDGYQVSSDNIAWVTPTGPLAHTFPSLTNGKEYTLYVRAVNSRGAGPSASAQVTPVTDPSMPQNVTATAGNASATLRWEPPMDTGGSVISGYRVSTNGALWQDLAADAREYTFKDLQNGQAYTLYVKAFTAAGDSPAATAPVTPLPASETTLTIDPIYENDLFITGTGEADGQIYLVFGGTARRMTPYHTVGAGALAQLPGTPATVVGTRWYYNISALSLRAGDTITVIQTVGGETRNVLRATVASRNGFLPPVTINPPAPGDTQITGTAVPGATITVSGPDGTPIGIVTADWTGKWAYPLPAPIQQDDIYLVTQTVGPLTSAPVPAALSAAGESATARAFEAPPSGYGIITGSRVNARERPSLDAAILTQLSQGTRVRIVDWGMTGDDGSGPWCKITVNDQLYFVHNDYVDGTAPF